MAKYVVGAVVAVCVANRILFGIQEYSRLTIERETDVYMAGVCDGVDYKKIGRHAALCAELEHRLSTGIMFHTIKSVVDDTLYREATLHGIAQTGLLIILLAMGSALWGRYIRTEGGAGLPTTIKSVKLD
jgi:hypothetical protein